MANRALQKTPTEIRSLARSFAPLSIKALAGIIQHSENDNARVAAIGMMLDRGFGKVSTALDPDGSDVVVTIRQIIQHVGAQPQTLTIDHEQSDSELDEQSR